MGIHGNRVRSSPRRRSVERSIERRNDLLQDLALRVDDTEHGTGWVGAGGGVIASVAGVKPDFVGAADSEHVPVDFARSRIHDDLLGIGGLSMTVKGGSGGVGRLGGSGGRPPPPA